MLQEEKYNLISIKSENDFPNILINKEVIIKNNLIADCSTLSQLEIENSLTELENISLTLTDKEKTFVVVHPSLPTDEWDEFIVIPTIHEAKEYIFMEELSRNF